MAARLLVLTSRLALHVALRAVALRFERGSSGGMAGSARSFPRLGGLVHGRLEVQRSLRICREQLVVAGLAVALGGLHMRGVVESYVSVLGGKRKGIRRFLILGKKPQRGPEDGDQ